MIVMRKYFFYLLAFYLLNSCNQNIDEVFTNENLKSLFIEFCDEVSKSPYRDGNQIIISMDMLNANKDYCIFFDNTKSYLSEDKFGYFRYNDFHIYVNENVPKNLIKLDNYTKNLKSTNEKAQLKEFVEMYICTEQDTIRVKRINFENDEYLNNWQILK